MREVTSQNFGLLIAYVLPGFTVLWGVSPHSSVVREWLAASGSDSSTVGGFLYVTLASVGLGMTVSTVRWLTIDPLHHRTGITRPNWDFATLSQHTDAIEMLIQNHYRYYQWYANMAVALPVCFVLRASTRSLLVTLVVWTIFYFASRDTLSKYYQRVESLLSS